MISFDTQEDRDAVFKKWESSLEELEASKAVFRPVYESENGDIRILTLRYSTPEKAIEVEKARRQFFTTTMKLIGVYNELERTFEQVNF